MSCCGSTPDFNEIDEVSRLVSSKTRRVPAHVARQRLSGRPRRGPRCGVADGVGLCGEAGPAALGPKASVLGAEIRLGEIRRAVRRVLAGQTRALALDHGWLGEGGQQPVAEEPAGQGRGRAWKPVRDRPGSVIRRCAGGPRRRGQDGRRLARPTISPRSIFVNWPIPSRSRRPMPPRRGSQKSCARG